MSALDARRGRKADGVGLTDGVGPEVESSSRVREVGPLELGESSRTRGRAAGGGRPGNGVGLTPPARRTRPGAVLAAVCSAALIVNLDTTILNVALPTLATDLRATAGDLQWIVDSYAIAFAGLLLLGGSLADRVGRRRLFLLGLAVFAAGSLGAALSGSTGWLVASRAVMGAGAALTVPASLSILNDVHPDPAGRARAIIAWAGTIGLGIALGPVAGGVLLERYSWGSVFLVNLPIAVAAAVGAVVLVPGTRCARATRSDPLGAALSTVGLGLVLGAVIQAPTSGWGSPGVLAAGVAGLAAFGCFLGWEGRCAHPMLPLWVLRDRRLSVAAAGEVLGAFGLLGALFVLTQLLQLHLGYPPLAAGLRLAPVALALVVTAAVAPAVVRAWGARWTLAAGLAVVAVGLGLAAAASTGGARYPDLLPGMLAVGVGAGLLLPTATDVVVGAVPRDTAGLGSAISAVALQVGGALGVAVIGSVAATRAGGVAGRAFADTAAEAFMAGARAGLTAAAVVALCGAVVVACAMPGGRAVGRRAGASSGVESTGTLVSAGSGRTLADRACSSGDRAPLS